MRAAPTPRVPLYRRRPWAFLRLLRPRAALAGAGMAVGFAFIAADGAPGWHETLRLALAVAAVLAASAAYNDVADAPYDHDRYLWRPLPSGLVTAREALYVALVFAVAALALGASLGTRPLILALAGLLAGATYSSALRATALSWLPFSLAFALVPPFVYESLDRFRDPIWWSFLVGALGGLSFYLLFKLPDYERDDIDGQRNLLHWASIDYAIPITWAAIGAYAIVAAASANAETLRLEWFTPPLVIILLLTLGTMALLWGRITERRLELQRWLLSPAVLAMAAGWLGSINP